MALSFEGEMRAFIKHRLEQQPAVQALTVGKEHSISIQGSFDYIGACMTTYQDAIFRIAAEIDALRDAPSDGKD